MGSFLVVVLAFTALLLEGVWFRGLLTQGER